MDSLFAVFLFLEGGGDAGLPRLRGGLGRLGLPGLPDGESVSGCKAG